MFKRIVSVFLCLFMLEVAIYSENAPVEEVVHIDYMENTGIVRNPGKGNMLVLWSPEIADLISYDVWQYVDCISVRNIWSNIEPTEGNINWDYFDTYLEIGRKHDCPVIFGVMTLGVGDLYSTPKWVFDAGARGVEAISSWKDSATRNDPTEHPCIVPDYNDAIFIEKHRNLVEALAERYDGNEYLYGFTMLAAGTFGEGGYGRVYKKTGGEELPVYPTREAIWGNLYQPYIDNFQNAKLIYNCVGGQQAAIERGIAVKKDDFMRSDFGNYVGGQVQGRVPVIAEVFDATIFTTASNWTVGPKHWDDRYLRDLELSKATMVSVSSVDISEPSGFINKYQYLMDYVSKNVGYRFYLKSIDLQKEFNSNIETPLTLKIANRGTSRIHQNCFTKLVLLDDGDNVAYDCWLDDVDANLWYENSLTTINTNLKFDNVADGHYKLAIGFFDRKTADNPRYRLANFNSTEKNGKKYYILGNISASSGVLDFSKYNSDDDIIVYADETEINAGIVKNVDENYMIPIEEVSTKLGIDYEYKDDVCYSNEFEDGLGVFAAWNEAQLYTNDSCSGSKCMKLTSSGGQKLLQFQLNPSYIEAGSKYKFSMKCKLLSGDEYADPNVWAPGLFFKNTMTLINGTGALNGTTYLFCRGRFKHDEWADINMTIRADQIENQSISFVIGNVKKEDQYVTEEYLIDDIRFEKIPNNVTKPVPKSIKLSKDDKSVLYSDFSGMNGFEDGLGVFGTWNEAQLYTNDSCSGSKCMKLTSSGGQKLLTFPLDFSGLEVGSKYKFSMKCKLLSGDEYSDSNAWLAGLFFKNTMTLLKGTGGINNQKYLFCRGRFKRDKWVEINMTLCADQIEDQSISFVIGNVKKDGQYVTEEYLIDDIRFDKVDENDNIITPENVLRPKKISKYEIELGTDCAAGVDGNVTLAQAVNVIDGYTYICVDDLANLFGGACVFDSNAKTITISFSDTDMINEKPYKNRFNSIENNGFETDKAWLIDPEGFSYSSENAVSGVRSIKAINVKKGLAASQYIGIEYDKQYKLTFKSKGTGKVRVRVYDNWENQIDAMTVEPSSNWVNNDFYFKIPSAEFLEAKDSYMRLAIETLSSDGSSIYIDDMVMDANHLKNVTALNRNGIEMIKNGNAENEGRYWTQRQDGKCGWTDADYHTGTGAFYIDLSTTRYGQLVQFISTRAKDAGAGQYKLSGYIKTDKVNGTGTNIGLIKMKAYDTSNSPDTTMTLYDEINLTNTNWNRFETTIDIDWPNAGNEPGGWEAFVGLQNNSLLSDTKVYFDDVSFTRLWTEDDKIRVYGAEIVLDDETNTIDFGISVDVMNNTYEVPMVYFAFYNDEGALLDLKTLNLIGAEDSIYTSTLNEVPAGCEHFKMFIWDGNIMKPIFNCETFETNDGKLRFRGEKVNGFDISLR